MTLERHSRGRRVRRSSARRRCSKTRSVLCAGGVACLLLFTANAAVALDWVGVTLGGTKCTGKGQGFGPWDFFDVDEPSDKNWTPGRWWEAREIHARPGLAALNAMPLTQVDYNRAADEFDYLLRAYPNHPEILGAVIELEMRRKSATSPITASQTPPECYLARAQSFRDTQPHIFSLMGYYYQRLGRIQDALDQYRAALELDPAYAEAYYNIGLAYVELGDYELAVQNAHEAYALGFPLSGLRKKLQRLGVWKPPTGPD